MIAVAYDNVTDTHSHPDSSGPLDLRTADLDRIALTDIVLDRFDQPRCGHVEIDRSGAEPDPQGAEADAANDQQNAENRRDPLDPAATGQPIANRNQPIAKLMPACALFGQQTVCTMMRGLVMLMIPIGIIPLQGLVIGARTMRLWRLFPCHCLSELALRTIAAGCARIDI